MKKRFLAALLVLVFLVPVMPVMANDWQALRDQHENALADVRTREEELSATRSEMDRIYTELLRLDDRLSSAVDDLLYIDRALTFTISVLAQAEIELAIAQEDLERQFEATRAWLRVMQEQGTTGFLSVLFQATSLRDLFIRMENVNTIARHNEEMVERLIAYEARVAEMQNDYLRQLSSVEGLQQRQQGYIEYLEQLEAERETFFMELMADEERQIALVAFYQEQAAVADAAWRAAYQEHQRQLEQQRLERERRRTQERIRNMSNLNGQFLWPIPSVTTANITSPFGNRRHPISRRMEHHDGIDIRAPRGTHIVAADGGTVILSGRHGGYGITVIIDHGGGLHTLYAHNSRNLVSVGDVVSRGQVVAHVGSTGVSTGNHLHFEVRVDGRPVNPAPFLGL